MAHKVRLVQTAIGICRHRGRSAFGLGIVFIAADCSKFLPVLGFCDAATGFIVLSVDIPIVRRWRRWLRRGWHCKG